MKRATKAKSTKSAKGAVVPTASAKKSKPSPPKKVNVAPSGLDFGELEVLRRQLDLSLEELTTRLGLSRATLQHRKKTGRLTTDESGKVVRFARLLGHAVHLFGGLNEARQWLKAPQRGLGNAVPLERAQTEEGAREVENLLGRIDHGASC